MNLCLPFGLHIIIILCFRQAMLRQTYTRNDEEVKNMPILTKILEIELESMANGDEYNEKKKWKK